jgi:ABC-type antimicrobial peptide transport system permease subunit
VFHLSYAIHELRRRVGRTVLTALGLALGVGLVIGIISVSQGLDDAQQRVLAPLGSVGTDILVTRVAGATSTTASQTTTSSTVPAGSNQGGGFFAQGNGNNQRNGGLNQADTQALVAENQNVVTDLSKLGEPGTQFTRDFFLSATLLSFPDTAVGDIQKIPGVTSAVGGLVQLGSHQTGTVPKITATIRTGGETFTQTVRPDPLTDEEQAAFQACLASKGITAPTGGGGTAPGGGNGGAGGGTQVQGGGRGGAAFNDCLPERLRELRATFTSPLQTIEQAVNPPQTDIKSESYTAAGVDPSNPGVGLITKEQLTAGTWLPTDVTNQILVNVAYANTKSLALGGTIPINGTDYTIVGLVKPTLTGNTADIYFPLATLQKLATKESRVTQVLVKTDGAGSVDAVAAAIAKQLPGAEVVTTKALADQVTGSLSDATSLANRLGGALSVIVLGAAFVIAALLTLSSIAKRVREIGTLRAIGWSKRRVVGQILGETVGIGVLGGILGVGIGVLVAFAVQAVAPSLSATTADLPGLAGSQVSGLFGQATSTVHTTEIAMTAPLHLATLLLGVAFAVLGGLLAGLIGGWRAARLSPVVALRDIG